MARHPWLSYKNCASIKVWNNISKLEVTKQQQDLRLLFRMGGLLDIWRNQLIFNEKSVSDGQVCDVLG